MATVAPRKAFADLVVVGCRHVVQDHFAKCSQAIERRDPWIKARPVAEDDEPMPWHWGLRLCDDVGQVDAFSMANLRHALALCVSNCFP